MRKTRVYISGKLVVGEIHALTRDASHHLLNVLKMREGDAIQAFDGSGGYFEAELCDRDRKSISILPLTYIDDNPESSLRLTLVQGIARGQKMDYTIQKAVELGASRIVPLLSEFSNIRLEPERASRRLEHWQRIIIAACEQCGRNTLPEIGEPLTLTDWLAADHNPVRLVLHPGERQGLLALERDISSLTLVCGPEGGLSEDEVNACLAAGYQGIALGPRILRTETAAVAAMAVCQAWFGDIG